jgi:protein TonB
MKRTKISMSKYILASALVLIGATVGCNSDSKKDEGSTVISADTTNAMNTTPAAGTTPTTDTVGATSNSSTSMATPNPAKKGKKGKVSLTENTAPANSNMAADNTGVYNSAEVMPAYPGGFNKMSDFFASNIEYPQDATDNGIEGTVDVNFAVDENGKLYSPKVVSPRIGYGIEEEALRVVNKMPTWTPGRIKGKNVKSYYTLPIRFQLY